MPKMSKFQITKGVYWIEVPEINFYLMCGCPADSVKHLMKRGLIVSREKNGVTFETGPNAILLSDVSVQNGFFSNMSEFSVLQMYYRQGLMLPGHPNNTGLKPLLIGSEEQVKSQMQYIYRSNYGLISEEEIIAAGVSPQTAAEMMRLKLKFRFGKIKPTDELLDSIIVGSSSVEIKNGLFVRRLRVNLFEFQYQGEYVTVDLNLKPHETYEAPYPLRFHNINREYFAIIHSGEGNGWDINRPCMSSIIVSQGKIYLVDAGPHILHNLKALGIGVNEIEGVFQTHAHDDHFAGLTRIMRSDHKIKYFAAPLVRATVIKKLAALVSVEEENFHKYFDVCDLKMEVWNTIDNLEVKPIFSPHPTETTIFVFRAIDKDGYQTYAHFADIASFDVLRSMITENDSEPGISREYFEQVKRKYLTRVNLKKLDVGGGHVHGSAADFKDDVSEKIILAHTSTELSGQQKEIGSGAPFGTVDVLIPAYQDYVWKYADNYLKAYFPSVPNHQINMLMNNPLMTFNPESILIKRGEINKHVYLILTGTIEKIRSEAGIQSMISAGGFVGDNAGLFDVPATETYRAVNFVKALQVPCSLFLEFIKRNGLHADMEHLREKRDFLQNTWLFSEDISYPIQNKIAQAMTIERYAPDEIIPMEKYSGIGIVKQGRLQIFLNSDVFETLIGGDFFGVSNVLFGTTALFKVRAIKTTEIYNIQKLVLSDIPIVHWKLFETYERRIRMILNPELVSIPIFQWREEYNTHIGEMDEHHQELFQTANKLYEEINSGRNKLVLEDTLNFLIHYTEEHFTKEEKLMEDFDFPEYDVHAKHHARLIGEVQELKAKYAGGEIRMDMSIVNFLKDWIVNHILTEDRKYGPYLNDKGVF
ncbi:MAG: bacteriohemerythrin [Desulfobacterales bacterium]|jgi:hemerythrin